jgi:hypothetical protein
MSKRIEDLRLAIVTRHPGKPSHESSTPIRETFRKEIVWESVGESFALAGHPKAKRSYGSSFQDNGEIQYVTALAIPPFQSPITAVRAEIAAETRGRK